MKSRFSYFLGVSILLLVFAIGYQLLSHVDSPNISPLLESVAGFSTDRQQLGSEGGFHYLRKGNVTNLNSSQRLELVTELNRPSVIEDQIITPQTTAQLVSRNGKTFIEVLMVGTTTIYSEEGPAESIYSGAEGKVEADGPISEVNILTGNESNQTIQVFVPSENTKFKLSTDPENSGVIWLDILL